MAIQLGPVSHSNRETAIGPIKQKTKAHRFTVLQGRSPISTRMLFHIHANEFGSHSQFEGMSYFAVIQYLSTFLEDRQKLGLSLYGLDQAVLDELKNAIDPGTNKEIFKRNVKEACLAKRPFLIPGGWVADPAHAIYYEYDPERETLRLYNLGPGAQHHPHLKISGKIKFQPYCEWTGISETKLLDPEFLRSLQELRTYKTIPESNRLTLYGDEDIYSSLKKGLSPRASQDLQEKNLWMRPQRSGVCPWKSLLALVCTKINDPEQYYAFSNDIKMQSLVESIETPLDENSEEDVARWKLIEKSTAHFSRSLKKRADLVDLTEAATLLSPVKSWIKAHKEGWQKINPSLQRKDPVRSTKVSLAPLSPSSLLRQMQGKVIHTEPEPYFFIAETFRKMPTSAKDMAPVLIEMHSLAKKGCEAGHYQDAYTGLIDWITTLSMEESFWKEACREESELAKQLIADLGKVAYFFFKTAYKIPKSNIIHADRPYALAKMLYIQEKLGCIAEPKWKEISFAFNANFPFHFRDPGLLFTLYDSKKQKDMKVLYEWLLVRAKFKMHDDLREPLGGSPHQDRWSLSIPEPKKEKDEFLFHLMDHIFPDLAPKIVKDFTLLDPQKRAVQFYMNDLLPEWFKKMRDTHLYFIHSIHESAHLGKDDFSIQFFPEGAVDNISVNIVIADLKWQPLSDLPSFEGYSTKQKTRFHRGHRPFASQEIQKVVFFLLGERKFDELNERTLLSLSAQDLGIAMSDEELRELCHFFLSPDVQLIETLGYFTKHPEKLKDPDYQTLFQLSLFNVGRLEKEKWSRFKDWLSVFMQQYLEIFVAENEVQPCVFFLKTARHLAKFCPDFPFFKTSLDKARELLKDQKDPSLRSLLYQEIAAHLGEKEELTEEEVLELLIATAYVQENPIPRKWLEPETEREGRAALVRHAKTIERTLCTKQALLNQVLLTLRPEEKEQKWEVKTKSDCFPIFETEGGKHLFFPLTGQCISPQREVILPLDIKDHPSFRRLFPSVFKATYQEGNIYTFKDVEKRKTWVRLDHQELIIEQQIGDQWFRFIPHTQFLKECDQAVTSPLNSRYLAERYSHWQSLHEETKILLVDLKSKKACYQVTLQDNEVHNITDLSDGSTLAEPSSLQHFEDPFYIHEWRGPPDKIELPRFGLSFFSNQRNRWMYPFKRGAWESIQYKDYVLSQKQRIPELGYYAHALVLEKGKDRKVLIPNQRFTSSKEQEILLPRFEIDRQIGLTEGQDQHYFVYDIQKDGKLFSSSLEANLYLSYVLTLCQDYRKGAFYLKKYGEKLGKYTERELELLEAMTSTNLITGDMSGNGQAFRTYAGILLFKDSLIHNRPLEEKILRKIGTNFSNYLAHRSHVTELILTEQELFLFFNALKDPEKEAALILFLRKKATRSLDLRAHLETALDPKSEKTTFSSAQLDSFLRTRPSFTIRQHLLVWIEWAQEGTAEQKGALRQALHFLSDSIDEKDQALASLLGFILEHPKALAPLDSMPFFEWRAKAIEEVMEYEQKRELSTAKPLDKDLFLEELPPMGKEENEEKIPPIPYSLTPSPSFTDFLEKKECFNKKLDVKFQESAKKLIAWLKTLSFSEPVEQKELARLVDDLTFYSNEEKPPTLFSFSENGLKEVEALIAPSEKEPLEILAQEILTLANHPFDSEQERALFNIEKWGGFRHKFTLDELIMSVGLKDPGLLKRRNPALTLQDLQLLTQKIGEYVLLSTEEQKKERARILLLKLKETDRTSLAYEDLVQELAQQLYAERHYDVNKHPEFLFFEYYQNILLRESQVKTNDLFLKPEKVQENSVAEMPPAAGKTTALPLIALLRKAVLIVPEPLFEEIASKTQKVLRDSYGVHLRTLFFDRNTVFNPHTLNLILHDLKNIEKGNECLIMTNKSLQCLLLKCLEKTITSLSGAELSEEFLILRQILLQLKKAGVHIDEVDTVARVMHMVCFDMQDKAFLTDHEVKIVGELYLLLYSDPEIKAIASLESDPASDPDATTLTKEIYIQRIKQTLAEKFYAKLSSISFSSSPMQKSVQKFLSDPENKELALAYLTRKKERLDEAQAFYNKQDEEVQEILALAGEEISALFPHTLSQNCNEKYGIDPLFKTVVALPFSAANVPTYGSQFANQHVTMNYTFQAYMKQGIERSVIVDHIHRLQTEAMKEMKEADEDNLSLHQTKAWKTFRELPKSEQLFNITESQIEAIVNAVNTSPSSKIAFISAVILPQLEIAVKTLNCNPHDLFLFCQELTGFTGTLSWNQESMNKKVTPKPKKGTDAKTLSILKEKSQHNILTFKIGSTKEMFDQLSQVDYDVLIDGGGYFKQDSVETMAKTLLEEGKPVVFYNSKGEQRLIQKREDAVQEISLSDYEGKPESRKTFLTQDKTIGIDVTQKPQAVGLVTIGRHELLKDLLQHVWRLRQLDKSQHVFFVVSEEVEEIIRESLQIQGPLTFDDLFLFAFKNQARQQGEDNAVAFRQELWGEVKKILFDVLLNEKATVEECRAVYKKIEPLWIKSKPLSARELYGQIAKPRKSKKVVQEEYQRCKDFVKALHQELPFLENLGIKQEDCLKEIKKTKQRMLEGLLHKEMTTKESHVDHTVEIQAQTQFQVENQSEMEEQKHREGGEIRLGYLKFYSDLGFYPQFNEKVVKDVSERIAKHMFCELPYFSLKSYLQTDRDLKEMADAFEGIHLTFNVLEWQENSLSNLKFLGPHRTPLEFFLVKKGRLILLSQHDAAEHRYRRTSFGQENLYHLTLGKVYKEDLDRKELKKLGWDEEIPDKEMLAKVVKIKFLDGISYYTKQERVLLKAWIEEQGPIKMQRFFEDKILNGYPSKRIAYQNSVLNTIFVQLSPIASVPVLIQQASTCFLEANKLQTSLKQNKGKNFPALATEYTRDLKTLNDEVTKLQTQFHALRSLETFAASDRNFIDTTLKTTNHLLAQLSEKIKKYRTQHL